MHAVKRNLLHIVHKKFPWKFTLFVTSVRMEQKMVPPQLHERAVFGLQLKTMIQVHLSKSMPYIIPNSEFHPFFKLPLCMRESIIAHNAWTKHAPWPEDVAPLCKWKRKNVCDRLYTLTECASRIHPQVMNVLMGHECVTRVHCEYTRFSDMHKCTPPTEQEHRH